LRIRRGDRKTLKAIVAMLTEAGIITARQPVAGTAISRLVDDFRFYLRQERRLSEATLLNYIPVVEQTRTSLVWRDDFAGNLADGWNDQGQPQEHDQRSKVRAAGSMDTTISDLPKFIAALVRGDGLSAASRAEMTKPQLHIGTAHQFRPSLLICR
jgi:hypothetical protein